MCASHIQFGVEADAKVCLCCCGLNVIGLAYAMIENIYCNTRRLQLSMLLMGKHICNVVISRCGWPIRISTL